MHTIKQFVKNVFSYALFASGYLGFLQRRKLKNKLVVLMYHRVLKDGELTESYSNRGIIVREKTFDAHIDYLKEHFNIISMEQLICHIKESTPLADSSCLITFDDGWIDNYNNAFPVLKKHNVPAVIFLPTNYIGTDKPFWQETLTAYIRQLISSPGDHQVFLAQQGIKVTGTLPANQLENVIQEHVASLKKLSNIDIDAHIDAFKIYFHDHNITQSPNNIDRYIDWEQVQTMQTNGISFGSHAISHRLLTKLDKDDLAHEIDDSKNILQFRLRHAIESIAYPNGNFNDSVIKQVKNSGYVAGFTTDQGYFGEGDDPYKIKRINIHQNATNNTPMFLCRILSIL